MSNVEAQLAKGALRLKVSYGGEEQERTFYRPSIIVGRNNGSSQPDLDLTRDNTVSRSHARIWVEGGSCWIEDLGSKLGTKVNGADIRGQGKVRVDRSSPVHVGETILKLEGPFESVSGFAELLPQPALASTIEIEAAAQTSPGRLILPKATSLEAAQSQALLLEILVQFSLPSPLDQLLQTIIGRVVELIPGAKRGALLLCNPGTDGLLLAAFVSPNEPAVSETLARRALKQEQAFVWRNNFGIDQAMSIQRHQIQSGMYAPLIYDGCPLGVVCVDNPECYSAFAEKDLQLLVTVADHAAVAVSHHRLREQLTEETKLQERLLTRFSPGVRQRLVEKARLGRLRPSMEKSQATLLAVELRGFNERTSELPLPIVQQLLNEYSAVLTAPVLKFGGTIARFTGERLLAVFGSPEPDPGQQKNAVHAAREIQQGLAEINARRTAAGQATCPFAAGIHCGVLIHGFIGGAEWCEFTIIGDVIEEALRYCHSAEEGAILMSEPVYEGIRKSVSAEKTMRPDKDNGELAAYRLTSI